MIDAQLLNNALATIAIACGAVIFLALCIVAIAAVRGQARTGRAQAVGGHQATPTGSPRAQARREPALR